VLKSKGQTNKFDVSFLTLTQQGMTELMKHQIYLFVLLTFTQQGMTELMKHQIYLFGLLTLTQQGMTHTLLCKSQKEKQINLMFH
jgi:hypothetical protein